MTKLNKRQLERMAEQIEHMELLQLGTPMTSGVDRNKLLFTGIDPAKKGGEQTITWNWKDNTIDDFKDAVANIGDHGKCTEQFCSQYHQQPVPANTEKERNRQGIRGIGDGGAECFVIDDEIKPSKGNMNKEFMDSVNKRIHKDAPIVVIQSRIHEDDFIGDNDAKR